MKTPAKPPAKEKAAVVAESLPPWNEAAALHAELANFLKIVAAIHKAGPLDKARQTE